MSESRSQIWLWFWIIAIAVFGLKCDYARFAEVRDLQRRVGQLESERR